MTRLFPCWRWAAKGVISVVSNVAPELVPMTSAPGWFDGDTAEPVHAAGRSKLIKALFADVNPIPVKWAMNRLGWQAGDCRLPLVAPSAAVQAQLENAMQEFGLLK